MIVWSLVGFTAIVIGLSYNLIKVFKTTFQKANITAKNYRNNEIPIAMGVVFPFIYLPSILIYFVMVDRQYTQVISLFSIMSIFTILGFIDDLNIERRKGIIGHIYSFIFQGQITIGFIKASFGILIGGTFSIVLNKGFENIILLDTLLIALSANSINSLDVKPGRATKGALLFGILISLFTLETSILIIYPAIIMLTYYLKGDLKEEYMMGDAGANGIGSFFGGFAVIILPFQQKLVLLTVFIALHILTEFYSLSRIIKRSSILTFFDNLGRQ
ncbi:hypothetical protein [Natranaerobius trueperi]|uniref:UDP-N-acetylmuramyl pentapeptide phosphotransferase n=1 Tax=Natranaerobius trueperi TaxID=759412 RepID=A0A226C086_9FIRM|nr:hypothetical protein [Natranaerobius trueperi]OWZ84004.1 hypothetical protein CDO51_05440 [Natranaerobius trueperi]